MIVAENVHKHFGDFHALKGISLSVKKGEIAALIGPSGSGKSTFVRTLNGLEMPSAGKVLVDGMDLSDPKNLRRIRHETGMVFQSFNLFPHLTVLENLLLAPLKLYKADQGTAEKNALELLGRVGIADQARKYPPQLSGGQQQRAAIARSLMLAPKIMIFDEATSSLDPEMTYEVLEVIRGLAKSGMTMLLVTHEMGFARQVADVIFFFADGCLIEQGAPGEFFSSPKTERAQLFLKRVLQ